MSSHLPSAIAVTERGPNVHYRLPRRRLGPLRFLGAAAVLLGLFVVSWPLLGTLFLLTLKEPLDADQVRFAVLAPVACFGPIALPVGGCVVFIGLQLIVGHSEVAIRSGRLSVSDCCGPLRWTRRRRLELVRGFRVEHGKTSQVAARPRAPGIWEDLATLKADLADGSWITVSANYPRAWLQALAAELAGRCQGRLTPEGVATARHVAVEDVSLDPGQVQTRPVKPVGSDIRVRELAGTLTLTMPPRGLRRGNGLFFLIWCLGWNAIVWPFSLAFVVAALLGDLTWGDRPEKASPLFAVCFLIPCWFIALGSLLALLNNARRRAVLTANDNQLTVRECGLFSHTEHVWPRSEVAAVKALCRDDPDSETGQTLMTELCVVPRTGAPVYLLGDRSKAEAEWIATAVRTALELPAEALPH